MDVLDKYKKAWDNQAENSNKVSKEDIYKMTKSKSSSIVKWIFIICLLEFLLLSTLSFTVSNPKYSEVLKDLNILELVNYIYYINIAVVLVFIFLFYKNFKSINATDTTKSLMHKIIKTRKTTKYYLYYNIIGNLIVMIIFNFIVINTPNGMEIILPREGLNISDESKFRTIYIVSQIIIVVIMLAFLSLYYYLLYGILLKKLNRNYKDLAKLEG